MLSFASSIRVAEIVNGDKELNSLEMSLLYKKLPEEVKTVLLFNNWVMWSSKCNCERVGVVYDFSDDFYEKYYNLRQWAVDIICEHGILYEDIPVVNWENQNSVLKKCRKSINLDVLSEIGTYNFNLVLKDGKITPVDVHSV